jgi:DNA-binding NarL/FixJ family response regulator
VGIVYSGLEAIECVERQHPHIVLMDVRMPNMDGVEATWIIKQKHPETQIVMLTTFGDDEFVHEALYHGAVGYLLKDIPPDELIAAVRAVKKGSVLISPAVAMRLVEQVYQPEKKKGDRLRASQPEPTWLSALSKKEREVLGLIAKGFDNKEIAKRLFIAEQTVKNHASLIYSKIGARDRIMAMKMGMQAKLDSIEPSESSAAASSSDS